MGLAAHAQEVGAEASARAATLLGEVGSRMGESAASGLEAVRGASVRFTPCERRAGWRCGCAP